MGRTPQAIRGTQDIFGKDQLRFGQVVDRFDALRKLYGFQRVEMPIFEATSVFARSLGETTDVVSKEMYSFEDRSGDSLTLRPEFTAGIARALLLNGWQQHMPLKIATHGPLFRYERPQKGRYRQFHQIDAEILGMDSPFADVELLAMAAQLLKDLGIDDGVTLQLNTLGDSESRDAWREALIAHFQAAKASLSKESQDRLECNPLRILDSKEAEDRAIVAEAPVIDDYLTDQAGQFFAEVTAGLDAAGIQWQRNAHLVRGLDYYRHTTFEFVTERLGAQGTVLAGGRYDGLTESLGGNAIPAVGWAAGIERLSMLLAEPKEPAPLAVIIPIGEQTKSQAMALTVKLRQLQINAEILYKGNMKKNMQKANTLGAKFALILGEDELKQQKITRKDLASGEQMLVNLSAAELAKGFAI